MKMKKWITIAAALGLTFCVAGLTACGDKGASQVDYTITILDQDGDAVAGVTFDVLQGDKTVATLETDENGAASGTLSAGDYTVSYTELPSLEYDANAETAGIEIVTDFSLSTNAPDVTLTIANAGEGTSLNPYTCYYDVNDEDAEVMVVPTVKANSDNYYEVSRSADRKIYIKQANVTVIYKGVSYNAADGDIEIQSQSPVVGDFNYWAPIQIINETDVDINLIMTLSEVVVEEGETA